MVIGHEDPVFIRAHLHGTFSCLYFPQSHIRAKKNTAEIFPEIIGQEVTDVIMHKNERAFSLILESELKVTYKLYGNRSNIILFRGNDAADLFRSKLKQDLGLSWDQLDRELPLDLADFIELEGNPTRFLPTLGKTARDYLFEQGYKKHRLEDQYQMIMKLYDQLMNKPELYLADWQGELMLTMFPAGDIRQRHEHPIGAINDFFLTYLREGQLEKERKLIMERLMKALERGERYIAKNLQRIGVLEQENDYRKIADLIMANLHLLRPGQTSAQLEDFYHPGKMIVVRMNPQLTPQRNAENYYRKAKNQHLELERIRLNIEEKERQMEGWRTDLEKARIAESIRELRAADSPMHSSPQADEGNLPFHEFHWQGFTVWLGKSGKSNDEMLRKCRKNDLWLHAKDVAGAHVIIREKPGSGFPAALKEKAAALAAFHSKRRTDTLCPVILTPRKYVRKRKGSPAGQVIVDREEEVLLVGPSDWS